MIGRLGSRKFIELAKSRFSPSKTSVLIPIMLTCRIHEAWGCKSGSQTTNPGEVGSHGSTSTSSKNTATPKSKQDTKCSEYMKTAINLITRTGPCDSAIRSLIDNCSIAELISSKAESLLRLINSQWAALPIKSMFPRVLRPPATRCCRK